MARILQEKNLFLVLSKKCFSFTWKLEQSDLKQRNIKSPNFNITEKEISFLEITVGDKCIFLYLRNSKIVYDRYFVIIITDANNTRIFCKVESNFKNDEMSGGDLINEFRSFPMNMKYPITITCISKDLKHLSEESQISSLDSVHLNSLKELSSDFKKAMDLSVHCDFALNVKGETLRAHKMILGARSPVFDKMFSNDSLEAAKNEVDISDIGSETMKKLLIYLYTGTVKKYSFEENLELFYAADKYEVLYLRDICKMQLISLLAVDNACSLFALSVRHSEEDMKKQVVQFASANFKSVVDSESFAQLGRDDMTLLMRLCAANMNNQIFKK